MFRRLLTQIMFAGLVGVASTATAQAAMPSATYISIGEQTLVPFGWYDFCNRYKGECDVQPLPPEDLDLTPAALKAISKVNLWVNKSVQPLNDPDHWKEVDQWDYPVDGYGDCEDYALLKRKLLINEGFPRQALLITVVKDTHGEGHAILTVKTNRGEFVLDNLADEVRPWDKTGYQFVKRQSQSDPNVWIGIGAPTDEPAFVSR